MIRKRATLMVALFLIKDRRKQYIQPEAACFPAVLPKNYRTGNCTASQTTGSMNSSDDLSRSIKTLYGIPVQIKNPGVSINMKATHSKMNLRPKPHNIIRGSS
jgi:hypothetical protein